MLVKTSCNRILGLDTVSYTNKSNAMLFIAWHVGKAVYCCAGAVQSVVQVLCMCGGAPYILQVQTCMGLAGALGMHQARPCYWSQTSLLLTKNSKKGL